MHTRMYVSSLLFDKQDYLKWINKTFTNPGLPQYKAFIRFNIITNSYCKSKPKQANKKKIH